MDTELWSAIKFIGQLIVLPLLGLLGFLGKKIMNKQDFFESRQNKDEIRIAVIESQMSDTKSDIGDIKKTIESFIRTHKEDMKELKRDLEVLIKNGKGK